MGANPGGGGGKNRSMMAEINVTPFVDVMLVLLVIFMVTAPILEKEKDEKRKVDLDLPVTRNNANKLNPEETDKLILEIDGRLRVRIGEELIVDCSEARGAETAAERKKLFEPCFQTIEKKLGSNQKLAEQGELYLLADTGIPYGFVVGTMARIKSAGIGKLGMVTNPEYLEQKAASERDEAK